MRISDWSSDVCSSDLNARLLAFLEQHLESVRRAMPVDFVGQVDQMIAANLASGEASIARIAMLLRVSRRTLQRSLEQKGTNFSERLDAARRRVVDDYRSEEHTSELQSLMRISYAVFCLKKN